MAAGVTNLQPCIVDNTTLVAPDYRLPPWRQDGLLVQHALGAYRLPLPLPWQPLRPPPFIAQNVTTTPSAFDLYGNSQTDTEPDGLRMPRSQTLVLPAMPPGACLRLVHAVDDNPWIPWPAHAKQLLDHISVRGPYTVALTMVA